jgi:hypothetical protein
VVAAVALQVYRYDRWTPPSLQVTQGLDGGRTWRLACDWSAYGLTFPETYSHVDHPRPRRWLRIDRPIYEGGEAVVETAYVPGPRAGMGRRCRLREGANGRWTLIACERDWVS